MAVIFTENGRHFTYYICKKIFFQRGWLYFNTGFNVFPYVFINNKTTLFHVCPIKVCWPSHAGIQANEDMEPLLLPYNLNPSMDK